MIIFRTTHSNRVLIALALLTGATGLMSAATPVAALASSGAASQGGSQAAAKSSGLNVPTEAATYQNYGGWDFKVDELVRGPDGHIQAVVSVRNASRTRMPFTITDLDAYLIDANGRTVQRHGNLYRVSPGGPVAALVNAGSSQLEPGDELRARLLFHPSKGFNPISLRLKEPVSSQRVNTHAIR
jgi:hypothetical protein